MLDIQAIIDRHLTDEKMQGKTFYEGHVVIDLNNAIQEIKELRAALTTMQGAYELGVDTERAAVVAWLHRMERNARHWGGKDDERADIYARLADVFECGEHLKETS